MQTSTGFDKKLETILIKLSPTKAQIACWIDGCNHAQSNAWLSPKLYSIICAYGVALIPQPRV
jgi:hypothetical protein